MKAYLSVDLDYWCNHYTSISPTRLFKKIFRLNLPIAVVLHHHHLLEDINKRDLDTVINIDYHSDLADYVPKMSLNEGTWGNFVKFRTNGTFIWIGPKSKKWAQYCHVDANPFKRPVSGWKNAIEQKSLRIPWGNINAVGVCLSPKWLGSQSVIEYPLRKLNLQDKLNKYYSKKGGFKLYYV